MVWVTPCIEPIPSAIRATRGARPSRRESFAFSAPRKVVDGA